MSTRSNGKSRFNQIFGAGVMIGAGLATIAAHASILSFSLLTVDFTQPPAAVTNATWGGFRMDLTTNGLGSDGAEDRVNEFWIQSSALAVGTCWRPTTSCTVEMTSHFSNSNSPIRAGTALREGQWQNPDSFVQFYVRYSPDKVHWSTWQALDNQHKGSIVVPDVARKEYTNLLEEYAKQDVPWTSDEGAAARWIVHRQPDFFEKHLPFVGYIQFRTEGWLRGAQRIKSVEMDVQWVVGGMATAPKRPQEVGKHDGPWRFEAEAGPHPQ